MSYLIAALTLLCSAEVMSGTEMLVGGNTPQDPSDPEFMQYAWKAVQKINEDPAANAGPYVMFPIKVLKAESQVVNGVIYKLEVLFGESTFKKGEVDLSTLSSANAEERDGGNQAIFKVNHYARPWQKYEEVSAEKLRDLAPGELTY